MECQPCFLIIFCPIRDSLTRYLKVSHIEKIEILLNRRWQSNNTLLGVSLKSYYDLLFDRFNSSIGVTAAYFYTPSLPLHFSFILLIISSTFSLLIPSTPFVERTCSSCCDSVSSSLICSFLVSKELSLRDSVLLLSSWPRLPRWPVCIESSIFLHILSYLLVSIVKWLLSLSSWTTVSVFLLV